MKSELAKLHRETIPPLGMLPISVPERGCVAELHKKIRQTQTERRSRAAIRYAEEVFRHGAIAYSGTQRAALQRDAGRFS